MSRFNFTSLKRFCWSVPRCGKQLLCFVHGQGQKREQEHTTKNFVQFHDHSPLFTMSERHYYLLPDHSSTTQASRAVCPHTFYFLLTDCRGHYMHYDKLKTAGDRTNPHDRG